MAKKLQDEKRTENMVMPAVLPVTAKHGKRLREEPIAQLYEQGRVHHVGEWPVLEQQMVVAGMDSPDRVDAAVHALTQLSESQLSGVSTLRNTTSASQGARNQLLTSRYSGQELADTVPTTSNWPMERLSWLRRPDCTRRSSWTC